MSLQGSAQLLSTAQELLQTHLRQVYHHLQSPDVQEVMINSPKNIWLERNGEYERLDVEISSAALSSAITILGNLNRKNITQVMDCRLPGLRIAATLPPVSVHGPSMSIRRHSARNFTLDDYLSSGALDPRRVVEVAMASDAERPSDELVRSGRQGLIGVLKWMVLARVNYAITGSTSSGKTALLNALAAFIPASNRVVTIEDTAELRLQVPNWVSFEANAASGIAIRDLVRHTLRYRPNRILVGEIRGAEAFDMVDAYNTGHPGSAVSFHSDSAELGLSRLENMVRMAPEASNWPLSDLRRQIASTFRFVVHASNVMGHRGPTEVIEILGAHEGGYHTKTLFKKHFTFTQPATQ